MSVRSIGLVLLVWFPGVLHAGSTRFCQAPSLNHGYLVPSQSLYDHDSTLNYGCDRGHKPAVKGWWAAITCQDGKWSHKPECIAESACLPFNVPNGIYPENSAGWYEGGSEIRITCDEGYEHANRHVARCVNGLWSPLPGCQKSWHACGPPPKVSHAVVINEEYKEVFAHGSRVWYECDDRFTTHGTNTQNLISCGNGAWTEGPRCIRTPDAAGSSGGRETSSGGRTQPTGGGSPTSSGGRESQLQYATIDRCGQYPHLAHGDFVEKELWHLKYQCVRSYMLVGPPTVRCFSNGSWTEAPTCKAAFCTLNTGDYPYLVNAGSVLLENGDSMKLVCVVDTDYRQFSEFHCRNGKLTAKACSFYWSYG